MKLFILKKIRPEIQQMIELGSFPSEDEATTEHLRQLETLFRSVVRPISDDEANELVKLFGTDGCFGLASSVMHLIETAPSWPIKNCLTDLNNPWVVELQNRAIRGGLLKGK
ncbi:hypothetical protein AAKU67_004389 [Oxalobacteraceae bacterium GrIS 2.11]